MRNFAPAIRCAAAAIAASWCLAACTPHANFLNSGGMWQGPKDKDKDESKPGEPLKVEEAKPQAQPEASPITMKSFANGPVIQFSISNTSSRSIPVKREDFALVVPGGRRIIHYDSYTTNVEINPWPDSLKPGQTVMGRAIFQEISDPVGYRLVLNPRTGRRGDAAFTVITSPGAVSLARSAPALDPNVSN